MTNPLSDIYSNEVLLNESKKSAIVGNKKLKITPGNKVDEIEPLAKGRGPEKDIKKGYVKSPKEDAKFSSIKRKKGKSLEENMNTNNKYEGAFEKLFKATLTEDVSDVDTDAIEHEVNDHADDIPTSDEDMAEDIGSHEDEATDIVQDIKAVISSLESILDKLSEHEGHEGHEIEAEEGEEPFEESVDYEDHGHTLVNAKSGKDLIGPKGKFDVKGVKVTKGKADEGELDVDGEPKEEKGNNKELQNTKKFASKSTVKVGDFFK